MKERELREHAECSLCRNKIGATGVPLFYRVTVEQFGVDLSAVQRQQGLTMLLGGAAPLAEHMGPNEDMAHEMDRAVLTVCQQCALEPNEPVVCLLALSGEAESGD